MIALVQTREDPLGRLSYDVPGTGSGYWFLEGTPVKESFCACQTQKHLFLGTLQERDDTQIMSVGETWPAQGNFILATDPSAPRWTDVTAASGIVALPGWNLNRDGSPNYDFANGTVLLEVLPDQRVRIEWFDTHDQVSVFTSEARIYER